MKVNTSSSSTPFRSEWDSLGTIQVPFNAYYGAQTARAVANFPISNLRLQRNFIYALGLIKEHAANTNVELGLIDRSLGHAIARAAAEVKEGRWDNEFVVDVFQTGSGTSTNMNANEVIANRAIELLGGTKGSKKVHPNDHVNCCQSSNDVIPTAMHISALKGLSEELLPSIRELRDVLEAKSDEFEGIVKIGRTHLQDASPIRLGQEFSGYAAQIESCIQQIRHAVAVLEELPLGGTAVGTGINAHTEFASKCIRAMAKETGFKLFETRNHFAAQGSKDGCVFASSILRLCAVILMRISNDVRWLGSGPRCGIGEIEFPAVQPGSSIMPGKVNPVIAESLMQVCAQVIGNDLVVSMGAVLGSNFELNVMMPVMAYNLNQAIQILASASRNFAGKCIMKLKANESRCKELVEQSLSLATPLVNVVGYDSATRIAQTASHQNRTIREVAIEECDLDIKDLERILDPLVQTQGGMPSQTLLSKV